MALAGVALGQPSTSQQVRVKPELVDAEQFATAVSTPGNPQFHRYLSPDAYEARFGPTAIEASPELSSTRLGAAKASAARTARTGPVTCSRYWAEHVRRFSPAYRGLTKGSLPVCGYSARQLRAAYGANWAFTGKGQTIALTESDAPTEMFRTLSEYARRNHLPAPKPSQFREVHLDGGNCGTRSASQYNDEAEMDSEAVYAMAPGANQLMVVGGSCDEDQALLNAVLAVLKGDGHRPSASIVSNSWQIPIGDLPPQAVHALTVRAAAEGVGLYFSSGDTPGLTTTASDPFVTAVGGTTLSLGAGNTRIFETGWSNNTAMIDAGKWSDLGITGAGGGTSEVYAQPAYQKGVVPPSMSHVRVGGRTVVNRAVPDIAAVADLDTGMLTGYTADGRYQTQVNAGTSLAAPLVAGLVADAQQGQRSSFGFINPLIYRLSGTRAFHDVLPVTPAMPQQNRAAYTPATAEDSATVDVFDSRGPDTDQVTAKGYDTVTGVGTPNGLAFILGLRSTAG
ncbi:S53 family peptidase [Kribbella sp. NPDC000426]|uniref:S53 family peptidase n=1 Tax=Kribbella sp. NPDC000426 TaxID=3154255 RepID=UPI00331CBF9B